MWEWRYHSAMRARVEAWIQPCKIYEDAVESRETEQPRRRKLVKDWIFSSLRAVSLPPPTDSSSHNQPGQSINLACEFNTP